MMVVNDLAKAYRQYRGVTYKDTNEPRFDSIVSSGQSCSKRSVVKL